MVTYCLCYRLYLVGDLNSGKTRPCAHHKLYRTISCTWKFTWNVWGIHHFCSDIYFELTCGELMPYPWHCPLYVVHRGIVRCMLYIMCHQLCATKPSILCHHIWLVPNYISMSVSGSPSNLIGIISDLSQPPRAWRLISTNEIVKKWLCASQDIEIKNIYFVLLLGIKAFTQHLLFKYTMVGNFRVLKST